MFAVGEERSAPVARHARHNLVLPRLMRRPARLMQRLTSGEVEPPRFAALIASALLIGSSATYGAVIGGHMPSVLQAVTARTGFAIEDIAVDGDRYTSEIDIFQAVGLNGYTSLIGYSANEARERIVGLPWVEEASVRKVYPATLKIDLVERQAFAIWQQGSRLLLIEKDGQVIAPLARSQHADLPLVIGRGAELAAADFVNSMAMFPEIASRTKAYIRIADRRWDLRLDNGVTIRLPEEGADAALTAVIEADRSEQLLSRDIATIDLRLSDRMVLELTPGAMEQRHAMLKERLGKAYNPEKRS